MVDSSSAAWLNPTNKGKEKPQPQIRHSFPQTLPPPPPSKYNQRFSTNNLPPLASPNSYGDDSSCYAAPIFISPTSFLSKPMNGINISENGNNNVGILNIAKPSTTGVASSATQNGSSSKHSLSFDSGGNPSGSLLLPRKGKRKR
uniref:Uncharacterized protein n=1 Tax=Panagrolaimus sp. PS1159 TaxID=55785 RepID=A0AC35FGC2_9BILA